MRMILFFLKRHWLILIILLLIILSVIAAYLADFSGSKIAWGVTFSQPYTQNELGLNWQETYLAILDDLKVDHIRLSAYWNSIEKNQGEYDFADLDWQINEASKRDVKIILGVGNRLPRWPECHMPVWIKSMNAIEAEEARLAYVGKVVERYKLNPQITYWQVENEPFLGTFGVCPELNPDLLKKEIKIVKSKTKKPVLVTDSGELSTWWPITHVGGDVLGSTLYRVVYDPHIGYFRWFTPPFFYYLRATLIKKISPVKKVIVAELQAESWHKANTDLSKMEIKDHFESMDLKQFKKNIEFTRRAGFDEAYLWGVEWWYFMKTQKDYPDYWNEAKKLWPE